MRKRKGRSNPMRQVKTGEIYRHFKGNLYQVAAVARHCDTNEDYVVYQALYGDMQVWLRPYDEFVGEIDMEKYPQAGQRYRFELVNTLASASREAKPPKAEPETEKAEESRPETSEPEAENREPESREMEQADQRLLSFLDAATYQDKINYLTLIRNSIDDRLINDIAAAMDITVDDGPLDTRYFSLKNCLMTKAKYECVRRQA